MSGYGGSYEMCMCEVCQDKIAIPGSFICEDCLRAEYDREEQEEVEHTKNIAESLQILANSKG